MRGARRSASTTAALTSGDLERLRSRIGAYVYGNVLVLAAVVGCAPESVRTGRAVLIVLATTGTTYLAHVVAHRVGEAVGRTSHEARAHLREELRDAVPIVSSGVLPAAVLLVAALGWLDWLGLGGAQLVAVLLVVVRLALTGSVSSHLVAGRPPRATLWAGVGLALMAFLIAVTKVVFTH